MLGGNLEKHPGSLTPDACTACAWKPPRRCTPLPPELFVEVRGLRGFDVMPDGREIVAASRVPDSGIVRRVQLVVNWSEE